MSMLCLQIASAAPKWLNNKHKMETVNVKAENKQIVR